MQSKSEIEQGHMATLRWIAGPGPFCASEPDEAAQWAVAQIEAYRELLALIRAGDNSVEDLQAWLAEREA